MTENPLITVIVPFYKTGTYFEQCLESIVNQTLTDLEIILIDDCGGDKSYLIAQKYAQKDSRIKIIKNKKNIGQGLSRNIGMKQAKGEYIAFVDADDFIDSQMYEKLYNKALETNAEIIKCNFNSVYENNKLIPYDLDNICPDYNRLYNADDYPEKLLAEFISSVWNSLYKKSFLLDNNLFFTKAKYEDVLFCWENRLKAKSIAFISDKLYFYRKTNPHATTKAQKTIIDGYNTCKIIKDKYYNNHKYRLAVVIYTTIMFQFNFFVASLIYKKLVFRKFHSLINKLDKTLLEKLYPAACFLMKQYIFTIMNTKNTIIFRLK